MVWEKGYLQAESQITLDLLVPPLHCHLFAFLWKSTISQIPLLHSGHIFTFSTYYIQIYIKVLVQSVSSFGWQLWSFSISVHITWPHSVLHYSLYNLVLLTFITMSTPLFLLLYDVYAYKEYEKTVYFTLNMHLNPELLFTNLYWNHFFVKMYQQSDQVSFWSICSKTLSKVIILCFYTLFHTSKLV